MTGFSQLGLLAVILSGSVMETAAMRVQKVTPSLVAADFVDGGECEASVVGATGKGLPVIGGLFGASCQCATGSFIMPDSEDPSAQNTEDCTTEEPTRTFNAEDFAGKGCRCRYSNAMEASMTWEEHFNWYMADLKVTEDPEGFNKKCEPFISQAKPKEDQPTSRGLVFLQHGYTACAGFWYLLVPKLVEMGWTVMVPNMVGHGRNPTVMLDVSDPADPVCPATMVDTCRDCTYQEGEPNCNCFKLDEETKQGTPCTKSHTSDSCAGEGMWHRGLGKCRLDKTIHSQLIGNTTYTVTDYINDFPDSGSEYIAYSDMMIKIVRKYKEANPGKEVSLAGISLGGAVATYMAMEAPDLWDRVMLMNPFLAPPTSLGADYGLSFMRYIIPQILPAFKILRGDMISWGEACNKKRWPGQSGGHGGVCQFTLRNFRAVFDFANEVEGEARARAAKLGVFTGGVVDRGLGLASLVGNKVWQVFDDSSGHTPRADMKVQMLTSSNDGAIANARVHFASQALQKELAPGNFGYCVMKEEFAHVYISPVDTPERDHWWLDSARVVGGKTAVELLTDFISDGTMVPVGEDVVDDDAYIEGDARCGIKQAA